MTDVDTRAREMAASNAHPADILVGKIKAELDVLYRSGIVEIAVRNPSVADYMRHWEGRAEAAERERDEARDLLVHFDGMAAVDEARAAALRKALEEIEALLGLDNPSVIAVRAFQVAREALAADQAGGEEANISDARERLAAAPCDDVELPIGGEADKRIAAIARDWKDPALTPQPPQSEAGTVPAGWKLVPIEATEDMMEEWYTGAEAARSAELARKAATDAERKALGKEPLYRFPYGIAPMQWFPQAYRTMLAAAPSPPSGEDRVRELEEGLRPFASEADRWVDRRHALLLKDFAELQTAAQKVVDETDRIHDSEPWPTKYRAPYGAIVELRQLLAKQYGLRRQP